MTEAEASRGDRVRTPAIAALLGTLAFLVALATAGDMGLTWDEAYYFHAQDQQRAWFSLALASPREAFAADAIAHFWHFDPDHNPHPPFYKIASNVTRALFGAWLGPLVAHRAAPAAFYGGTVAFLFLLVRRRGSTAQAVGAALLWATTPRVFGHAHVAATDMPMSFFAVAATWSFVRAVERPIFGLALGVVLGMAFATKFTAVLIPVPLVAWMLLRREARAFRALAVGGVVAVVVAVVLTPYWWHDPIGGIAELFRVSLSREAHTRISVVYWGEIYPFRAPWHLPWTMIALATPLTLWMPAVAQAASAVRTRLADPDVTLWLLAALVPVAVVSLPGSPKHDGLRMFLPALPFIAALAAGGWALGVQRLVGATRPRVVAGALAVAVGSQGAATALVHPYQLSYYNGLVGGLAGAHEAGMEVSYWMEVFTPEVLADLERALPEDAVVNVVVGDAGYFQYLQKLGRLRRDLSFYAPAGGGADAHIVASRVSVLTPACMEYWAAREPRYTSARSGVPLVRLYEGGPPPLHACEAPPRSATPEELR